MESERVERTEPLIHDSSREAVPSIRGYVYQIARTALEWTLLSDRDIMYLEGAEDFDRLGLIAESVQVKDYRRPITLRSQPVAELMSNCWITRRSNPGRNVRYRLLTTAQATTEQGNPFGKPGILLWNDVATRSAGDAANEVRLIVSFILLHLPLPADMVQFLRVADVADVHEQVIKPLFFDVGLDATANVQDRIEERLALVSTQSGMLLSNTHNAVNAVLRTVWDTVTKDTDRVLKRELLLAVLQAANRAIVPQTVVAEAERFNEAIAAISSFAETMVPAQQGGSTIALQATRVIEEVPPLPPMYFHRNDLLVRASQILERTSLVAVCGPHYYGKTTTANALAGIIGQCAWVNVGANADATLRLVLAALRVDETPYRGMVLDGLPRNGAAANLQRMLVDECLARGMQIVLVPDPDLGALTRQALGISDESIVRVATFTFLEIREYLLAEHCPEHLADAWARVLELTTLGEPLLVHAHISNLQRNGFPRPNTDDLFAPPAELSEIRRDVRLIAAQVLDAAQFELLNRLSIGYHSYRRNVALRIAAVDPPIAEPGNALDSLTGAWIQELDGQRYRVLPIANRFGEQTHGDQWAERMHTATAGVILGQPRISADEASDALRHAFLGRDGASAHRILNAVSSMDSQVFESFAQYARWIIVAYIGEAQRPEFLSRKASALLRFAQIRVSIAINGAMSEALLDAFDAEYPANSDDRFVQMTRMIALGELLLRGKMAGLTEAQIARYTCEWGDLVKRFIPASVIAGLAEVINDAATVGATSEWAAITAVGFLSLGAVKDPSSLRHLVQATASIGTEFSREFFRAVNSEQQMSHSFILGLWAGYIGTDMDWESAVSEFAKCARTLFALDLRCLADEAAAAAVRLSAERAESAAPAVQLANELAVTFEPTAMKALERAKARALMLSDQYTEAVSIWRQVLPTVPWDGTDFNLYQDYRDAAISCARLSDWISTAEMLQTSADRTDVSALGLWKAALEFDAAFAHMRSSNFSAVVAAIMRGARILAGLTIDQSNDVDFMVMKRIGHTVSWINDPKSQAELGFEAPPPACASALDTTRPAIDLQPTEVDLVLAYVMQIAFSQGALEQAGEFEGRVNESPHLTARVQGRLVTYCRACAAGAGVGLVTLLCSADHAMNEFAWSNGIQIPPQDRTPVFLLLGGAALLGASGRITEELLQRWKTEARECGLSNALEATFVQIEGLFVTGVIDANVAVRSADDWFLQFLSSAKVASGLGNEPRWWFNVHALWVQFAGTTLHEPLGALFYPAIAAQWRILSQHPIMLHRPNVTVPNLVSALSFQGTSWQKILALMRAAADAVGATLPATRLGPQGVRHALTTIDDLPPLGLFEE